MCPNTVQNVPPCFLLLQIWQKEKKKNIYIYIMGRISIHTSSHLLPCPLLLLQLSVLDNWHLQTISVVNEKNEKGAFKLHSIYCVCCSSGNCSRCKKDLIKCISYHIKLNVSGSLRVSALNLHQIIIISLAILKPSVVFFVLSALYNHFPLSPPLYQFFSHHLIIAPLLYVSSIHSFCFRK